MTSETAVGIELTIGILLGTVILQLLVSLMDKLCERLDK